MRVPTDIEIKQLDDELASEGVPVNERATQAFLRWSKQIAWSGEFIPIMKHFEEAFHALHPSVKLHGRPFMLLCASARGVAYEYHPPVVFGQVSIDPIQFLQISPAELERIWNANPGSYWALFWQSCDCFDLFMSSMNNVISEPEAVVMAMTAKDQLQASARQLVALANDSSLPQACSLSAELAGKAALRQLGVTDLRQFGHDIDSIYAEIARTAPRITDTDVLKVSKRIPNYVRSRYAAPSLSTLAAQRLFAETLFLCSDAFRRFSDQPIYFHASEHSTVPNREWD